jgi:oligopeptidase A
MKKSNAQNEKNPLLITEGLPPFDRIKPEHIEPALKHVVKETKKAVKNLEQNLRPGWDKLLKPLEEMELPFEYAWGPVVHLMGVKNSDKLRKAHDKMLGEIVTIDLRIRQSQKIFEGLSKIRQSKKWSGLSEAQKRVIELKLRAARHAGVGLKGKAKKRFNEIEKELSQICTDFTNHVLDSTKTSELIITDKKDIKGWPENLKALAAQSYNEKKKKKEATPAKGPWRITLDAPSFVPFMQHSQNRKQREKLYKIYITRASRGKLNNNELIKQILRLRKEKAELLGFDSYAGLSLDAKMAPDVKAVEKMSKELLLASRPYMFSDFEDLKKTASGMGQKELPAHWDIAFFAERLREQRFDYTDEELRPYFPLPRVLEGLFSLSQKLFGIIIKQADNEAPVWHEDVRYFKVFSEKGEQIASFYLDPYSRPHEKRGGAWADECLSRRWVDKKLRLPVVYLCCNGTPPVGGKPSLMSFDEVRTLFHEFGHGLQGMLTTVDLADVAGLSGIEWDAVELASQFMENWCYHKPTLTGMTEHIKTKKPLPDRLFKKISKARTFRSGSMITRQLDFGMTDMELHHLFDPDGKESPHDVRQRIAKETSALPPLPGDRFLCGFTHIFGGGYAAGYYSYKWAEVLSADAFSAFEEAGLDNEKKIAKLGRHYRKTILALGGSREPMKVFVDFRGREPKTEALLRHSGLLNKD